MQLKKFDRSTIAGVEVFLAQSNGIVREGMRTVLRTEGFRRTNVFSSVSALKEGLERGSPDLVIADDDLGPDLFELIKDVRRFKVGRNPFVLVSLLVGPQIDGAVRQAIFSGADDIIIKPVSPGKLIERSAHISMHRAPFIVTTDYLGPERRDATQRAGKAAQIEVLNTLRDKVEGRHMTESELSRAVERGMTDVMAARLTSHGLKLGWVCNYILKAYEEKRIDTELHERLLVLVSVLEDAAGTARVIGQPDLADLCGRLARDVEDMAEEYDNPRSTHLDTIRKLTKAFELARTVKKSPPVQAAVG